MGRRRETPLPDALYKLLKVTPWWFGPLLALFAFILLHFICPFLMPAPKTTIDPVILFRSLAISFSWLLPPAILFIWLLAEASKFIYGISNRNLFNNHRNLAAVRQLSWHDFERYLTEYYRRLGYQARHTGSPSGDGGIDILLQSPTETIFVQCKQWHTYKVGPAPVRELLGSITSEKAHRGILITSGQFSTQAHAFAQKNPALQLIDGPQLEKMIAEIQTNPPGNANLPIGPTESSASTTTPNCPRCGNAMVMRTARKGRGAGEKFWGCNAYPACRGTRQAV